MNDELRAAVAELRTNVAVAEENSTVWADCEIEHLRTVLDATEAMRAALHEEHCPPGGLRHHYKCPSHPDWKFPRD